MFETLCVTCSHVSVTYIFLCAASVTSSFFDQRQNICNKNEIFSSSPIFSSKVTITLLQLKIVTFAFNSMSKIQSLNAWSNKWYYLLGWIYHSRKWLLFFFSVILFPGHWNVVCAADYINLLIFFTVLVSKKG